MNINKIFRSAALMLLGMSALHAAAQQEQMMQPLPTDPEVRIGQLPNGLTYMIRHNEYPEGQADFFIAQKVGCIQEEPSQYGLAHFLEHMAFNGTKNYPDNRLRDWLAEKGVMFGRDLNAYTGFDATVYNISSVPVNGNVNVSDSCLLILRDWAGNITLADDAIDQERGVIEQEWRLSNVGEMRVTQEMLPKMFPGSKYGTHTPIGTMDVVLNFPQETLRDYYRSWYRPDQQGIIVVGDIDVDQVENKIKELFSDYQVPEGAPVRDYATVADHQGTIVLIGQDPEVRRSAVSMTFVTDQVPREMRNTVAGYASGYVNNMITAMLNERLRDIAAKADAPFVSAGFSEGELMGFVKTKDGYDVEAYVKDGDAAKALESIYREVLRAKRGGFTEGEYERAKNDMIARLEKLVNNAASHPSTSFAREYVDYFVDNEPIPGVATELELVKMFGAMVPVAAINQAIAQEFGPDNRYIMAVMEQNDATVLPTEEQLLGVIAKVDAEDIEPLRDEVRTDPLIKQQPKAGTVKSIVPAPQWGEGASLWTLGNGVKLMVKPTKFKEDEVLLRATAKHGWGNAKSLGDASAVMVQYIGGAATAGDYSRSDLNKAYAGKNFQVVPTFGDYTTTYQGTSTVKDLPSMMEVFYAKFTDPTLVEDDYTSLMQNILSQVKNADKEPQMQFVKTLSEKLYPSARRAFPSTEAIAAASRDEIVQYFKSVTANAADYDFAIVGNVDEATLKPLVEKYIASLPANAKKAVYEIAYDSALEPVKGSGTDKKEMAMQTPQVWGQMIAFGDVPYTAKNVWASRIAGNILTERLLNKIREEMQACYSIWGQVELSRTGKPNTEISTMLILKPELADAAAAESEKIFRSLAENIEPAEMAKAREILLKDIQEDAKTNSAWQNAIIGVGINGVDSFSDAAKLLESVSADDVRAFCKAVFDCDNFRLVLLQPAQ